MFSNPEFLAEGAAIAALCEATGADRCFQNNILNLVWLCRHDGLHAVAATREQVVALNTGHPHLP